MSNPVIDADGNQRWHLNGELHRTDGPAYTSAYGRHCWYLNGKRHRTDGPAITYTDGSQEWCLNGNPYSFKDFCKKAKLSYDDEVMLRLKYNC